MSIYDKSQNVLNAAFSNSGDSILSAYDMYGNVVFGNGELNPTTINVLNYNVGQFYIGNGSPVPTEKDSIYYNLQSEIFRNSNAALCCIEEYSSSFSGTRSAETFLREFYNNVIVGGSGSGYFSRAICSNFPLSDYQPNYFSSNPNRYYDKVTANVRGHNVAVVVTHLDFDTLQHRASQAQELVNYLNDFDSFILCGDFNTGGLEEVNDEEYNNTIKPFLDAGYIVANGAGSNFIPTYSDTAQMQSGEGLILDTIITSSDIVINSVYADQTKVTDNVNDVIDHLPLVANITIGADL